MRLKQRNKANQREHGLLFNINPCEFLKENVATVHKTSRISPIYYTSQESLYNLVCVNWKNLSFCVSCIYVCSGNRIGVKI